MSRLAATPGEAVEEVEAVEEEAHLLRTHIYPQLARTHTHLGIPQCDNLPAEVGAEPRIYIHNLG